MTLADLDNALLLQGPALTRLTDEEFFDLCQHNPTLRLERTADHNIIAMPPACSESSRKSGEIYGQLWLWNRQHQLGYAYDSSAGFTMPDGSVRSPDATWLSKEKYEQLTEAQPRYYRRHTTRPGKPTPVDATPLQLPGAGIYKKQDIQVLAGWERGQSVE